MKSLKKASRNVLACLEVKSSDKPVVITDKETEKLADPVIEKFNSITKENLLKVILEDWGERPLKELRKELKEEILNFKPTVSIYIAQAKKGELQKFRMPLIEFLLKKCNCRHAHMVGINEEIMRQGMSADYEKVKKTTDKVYKVLKNAKKIVVEAKDTKVEAKFDKRVKWIPCDGKIERQGKWSNLPEGEIFTCPTDVNGRVSAYMIGDFFSEKYGVLKDPLNIEIENARVVKIDSRNKELLEEFKEYINENENGDRVGEFAIGTLVGLKNFIGNLLQDEKFPGIHIAFGHPYPDRTKVDWDCPTHVDVIPVECSIWVDDKMIMKKGEFLSKYL